MTGTLVGLGGRLRSGKDVFADRLVEKHGFVKMGMSDPLNEALLALNPIVVTGDETNDGWEVTYRELHDAIGYTEAKKNPEVRRLLQVLGTEVGREMIGESTWTDIAARKIREHWSKRRPVVITGIRFPNELAMIRRLGGESVWISRPSEEAVVNDHASESGVKPGQFLDLVHNTGTLEDLERQADLYVRHHHPGKSVA